MANCPHFPIRNRRWLFPRAAAMPPADHSIPYRLIQGYRCPGSRMMNRRSRNRHFHDVACVFFVAAVLAVGRLRRTRTQRGGTGGRFAGSFRGCVDRTAPSRQGIGLSLFGTVSLVRLVDAGIGLSIGLSSTSSSPSSPPFSSCFGRRFRLIGPRSRLAFISGKFSYRLVVGNSLFNSGVVGRQV